MNRIHFFKAWIGTKTEQLCAFIEEAKVDYIQNDNHDDHPDVIRWAFFVTILLGLGVVLLMDAYQLHRLLTELKWIAEVVR